MIAPERERASEKARGRNEKRDGEREGNRGCERKYLCEKGRNGEREAERRGRGRKRKRGGEREKAKAIANERGHTIMMILRTNNIYIYKYQTFHRAEH